MGRLCKACNFSLCQHSKWWRSRRLKLRLLLTALEKCWEARRCRKGRWDFQFPQPSPTPRRESPGAFKQCSAAFAFSGFDFLSSKHTSSHTQNAETLALQKPRKVYYTAQKTERHRTSIGHYVSISNVTSKTFCAIYLQYSHIRLSWTRRMLKHL